MDYKKDINTLHVFVQKYHNKNTSSRAICLVKMDLFFDLYKEIIYENEDIYYEYYTDMKSIYKKIDQVNNIYHDNYESLCEIWLNHYTKNGGIII
jgi:hypothetical protein